ncbi:MAG TPA: glycosyltransferase [Nocardioides sp.]|nr:glycosyltransferase [Nocardioides sp.]
MTVTPVQEERASLAAVWAAVPQEVWRTLHAAPLDLSADGVVEIATGGAPTVLVQNVLGELLDHDIAVVQQSAATVRAHWAIETGSPFPETDDNYVDLMVRVVWDLVTFGLVDEETVLRAVLVEARTGEEVADLLVADGSVGQEALTAVIAHQTGLPRADLVVEDIDLDVAGRVSQELSLQTGAIAVQLVEDRLFVVAARVPSDEQRALLLAAVPEAGELRVVLVTPSSLDRARQVAYREEHERLALRQLIDDRPGKSAVPVLTVGQKIGFVLLLVLVIACAIWRPAETAIAVTAVASLIYLVVSVYRFALTFRALGRDLAEVFSDEDLASLDERDLPTYTILVPLYREAAVVGRLVEGIHDLDYPRTRLDVKLLCEEDDQETIAAIEALDLPPQFRLVVVPDGVPKTKPKACNYGLASAEGAYSVIFDAEDRPDPEQLKKAVLAFRESDPRTVCVQAKLNYYNGDQNLLTRWFANEYSMHFELLLPALAADGAPIPLGGTSNHFRTEFLRQVGAWDPYNVTEDADLGIRLARDGYRTAMIDSTTYEEANSRVRNWVRQRSRWIKGYLQTWLVHMRQPFRALQELGPRGFVSFNITLGGAFVHLMNPIFWALTTLWFLAQWGWIERLFPGPVYYLAALMLFVGNFVFVYLAVAGSLQRGQFELTRYALWSPVYWGLMAWAAWKAFGQLFTNPFYWEKTEHGLDRSPASATTSPPAAVAPEREEAVT